MSRSTSTNFTGGNSFPKADAATDPFLRQDIQQLAAAVDGHDHTTGKGLAVTGGIVKYAEVVLGSAQASVTLPVAGSLPQTYRSVRITGQARCDVASTGTRFGVRFNADSSAIYDYQIFQNNQSATGQDFARDQTNAGVASAPGTSTTTGSATAFQLLIPNYSGTTFWKEGTTASAWRGSGLNMEITYGGIDWRSTAAITSVTLVMTSGNFIAGSVFSLYLEP